MNDTVIAVKGIGKKYRIRHNQTERYSALRDVIADKVWNVFRPKPLGARRPLGVEDFWALKDVSFEVKRGEIVGVIGRNGAGKSTLLKILSRITEPTEGRVEIDGRVGSLLEVGTGFHPELTGRENIYLNGAIMGMKRAEIKRKFDEIVAFADVEKFLDTPVKRYSSGMYVRLAFSVAAHLEPEILIVDEVLAVGDAEFQKKCLGRMGDIASKEGRTILFVSHNMAAVSGLCGRACWLDAGTVVATGSGEKLVREYLAVMSPMNSATRLRRRHLGYDIRIEGVQLLVDNIESTSVQAGQPCVFRVHYRTLVDRPVESLSCSILLFSAGQKLVNLWTNYHGEFARVPKPLPMEGFVDCHIAKWPFRNHTIQVDVFSHTGYTVQDWIEEALIFSSHDGNYYGSGVLTNPEEGIFFLDHSWTFHAME
jgi:lipopolysaccharide transport system ATP-binding protein